MNILFIFNFGSELRQFVYSGLINELIQKQNKIFISSKVSENDFLKLFPAEVEIVPYFRDKKPYLFNLINLTLNESSKSNFKFNRYNFSSNNFKNKIFNLILSILIYLAKYDFFRRIFIELEKSFFYSIAHRDWAKLLSENKIDKIINSVPNMNVSCLNEAMKLGIDRILIFHTNKDAFVLDRFIVPYTKYGVWNEEMREFMIKKFFLDSKKVIPIGCLHFYYLMHDDINNPKSNYPVEQNLKTFTYVCGALNFKNEDLLFEIFLKHCKQIYKNNFKIFLRINPMETRSIWDRFESECVELIKPMWYYNQKENFNYALPEDLESFSNILKNSIAVFGLPSTVFIESALVRKPFFVLLNEKSIFNSNINGTAEEYWKLPVFDKVREFKTVNQISNNEHLITVLRSIEKCSIPNQNFEKFIKSEIHKLEYKDMLKSHLRLIIS